MTFVGLGKLIFLYYYFLCTIWNWWQGTKIAFLNSVLFLLCTVLYKWYWQHVVDTHILCFRYTAFCRKTIWVIICIIYNCMSLWFVTKLQGLEIKSWKLHFFGKIDRSWRNMEIYKWKWMVLGFLGCMNNADLEKN